MGTAPFKPPEPVGFLDALSEGVIIGWARDPADPAALPVVRLMRGQEVLVEAAADSPRGDGLPGFRLQAPVPVTAHDLLEGRMRVRVSLPSRPAPVTLAMTAVMRAALEAEAGWEPTIEPPPPPPRPAPPPEPPPPPPRAAPPPPAPPPPAPPPPPPPKPAPAATPPPAAAPPPRPAPPPAAAPPRAAPEPPTPAPAASNPAPLLRSLNMLSEAAAAASVGLLHLVIPDRDAVLRAGGASPFAALEAEAAGLPAVARNWVPLRAAFEHEQNPGILWRADGLRPTVEGTVATLRVLLTILRARLPGEAGAVARARFILDRADLASRPRRDLPAEEGPAFFGQPLRETEPVLDERIFFDLPRPTLLPGLAGIEAWTSRGAPLPWRILLLTTPGLGGSPGPVALGWWLRHLATECVISDALLAAPPEAALAVKPGLILTLAQGA
jgi:outer membrane biosynthesis protein TonB